LHDLKGSTIAGIRAQRLSRSADPEVMAAYYALRTAVMNGKAEDLEELARHGADVNAGGKPS